jgi:hypothetical protein
MLRHSLLIAWCALALAGCDLADTGRDEAPNRPGIGANGRRDLTGSEANIGGEKEGKTYAVYDAFRDRSGTGLAFAGYGCESNCADVMSGYQRARRERITEPRRCSASTWGQLEGCVAFAQGFPPELSSLPPLREVVAR